MPCITARRPNNNHHSPPQMPNRDDAHLSVIEALILVVEGQAREDLFCISKIKATLFKRGNSLCWVERDPYGFM
jgi:hypothetical protein